jgi:hypothetical protein
MKYHETPRQRASNGTDVDVDERADRMDVNKKGFGIY